MSLQVIITTLFFLFFFWQYHMIIVHHGLFLNQDHLIRVKSSTRWPYGFKEDNVKSISPFCFLVVGANVLMQIKNNCENIEININEWCLIFHALFPHEYSFDKLCLSLVRKNHSVYECPVEALAVLISTWFIDYDILLHTYLIISNI